MKKIFLYFSCIMAIVLLSGCSFDNTPTKKVENFLDNYKNQDETVLTQLKDMISTDSLMNDTQKSTYEDIMKKQYKDMSYVIKDETIDGDTATVTTEIEVYDYYKINKDAEDYYNNNPNEFSSTTDNSITKDVKDTTKDVVDDVKDASRDVVEGTKDVAEDAKDKVTGTSDSKYVEYRLGKLKEAKDRVKYTIDFKLTKVNNIWTINYIDDVTRQKIHGLYEH